MATQPALPTPTNFINGDGTVSGTAQNDQISLGNGTNLVYAGAGDDIVYGGSGDDTLYGQDGNDYLYGSGGTNALYGGAGNDSLYGGSGNDLMVGGPGDNFIYGGAGVNTASFGELRSQSKIDTATNNGTTVVTGPEGSDTMYQMSVMRFLDGTYTADTGSTVAQAYRLYQAAFNRAPDMPGLAYFIDQLDRGAPLAALAQTFIASGEFATRFGGTADQLSNQQYVTQLYQNVLGRSAGGDAAGTSFWVNALNNKTVSKAQVLADFSESAENVSHTKAAFANGMFVPSRAALDVAAAYKTVLGKQADQGGMVFWTTQIQNGLTLQGLTAGLLASTAFTGSTQQGAGAALGNADFVSRLIQNAEGKAQPNAAAFWTAQLNAGAVSKADVAAAYANANNVQTSVLPLLQNGYAPTAS